MRKVLISTAVALAAAIAATSAVTSLAFPHPATAAVPYKEVVEEPGYGYSFYNCGFEATYSTDVRAVTHYFFDAEGNLTRIKWQVFASNQVWTNPQTGAVLTSPLGEYNEVWNAGDEFVTFSGKVVVITVNGSGVVFQDAGRIQVTGLPYEFPFVAGRHDFWLNQDRICPYLAP